MKNKGIAIHYILMLLVGILVVGIIVYFVYRYFTASKPISEAECRARIISYCTGCYNSQAPGTTTWSGGPQLGSLYTDCATMGLQGCTSSTNCGGSCGTAGTVRNICMGYIPIT